MIQRFIDDFEMIIGFLYNDSRAFESGVISDVYAIGLAMIE